MLKPLLDPCSIIRVQTWDCGASAPSKVEQVVGTPWPQETGAVAKGRADILCTGPSDWWVLTSDPDAIALKKQLSTGPHFVQPICRKAWPVLKLMAPRRAFSWPKDARWIWMHPVSRQDAARARVSPACL